MQEIHKIYYIIHPAFWVGLIHSPENNRTEQQAEKYISQVLLPLIKQAQREQTSFVVFLKSPFSEMTFVKDAPTIKIEKKFEAIIKRMLPKRSLSLDTPSVLHNAAPKENITREILTKLEKFNMLKKVEIHAYGSFRDMCVNAFSKHLAQNLPREAKLKIVEAGTIPFKGAGTTERMKELLLKDKKRRAIIEKFKKQKPAPIRKKLVARLIR